MRLIKGIACNIAALTAAPLTATGHVAGYLLIAVATVLALTIPFPPQEKT